MKFYTLLALFMSLFSAKVFSADMVYYYHPPESPLDVRYNYHWSVLKTALETTSKKYGLYSLRPSLFMTEERQLRELAKNGSKLNVMIRETNKEFEQKYLPVRIPIDRNLIGYRVFLIDKKNKDLFKNINNLEDLKKITMGQGAGWGDVEILKHSGFQVKTEVYYDKIFEGLLSGSFQAFPRSVTEILDEYEKRKTKMPDLMIEDNILLYYPLPTYFWFPRTEQGRRLRARVKEGMEAMINNGSFDRLFDQFYKNQVASLKLKRRKLIKIDNPLLPESTPFSNKKLWVDINNF